LYEADAGFSALSDMNCALLCSL